MRAQLYIWLRFAAVIICVHSGIYVSKPKPTTPKTTDKPTPSRAIYRKIKNFQKYNASSVLIRVPVIDTVSTMFGYILCIFLILYLSTFNNWICSVSCCNIVPSREIINQCTVRNKISAQSSQPSEIHTAKPLLQLRTKKGSDSTNSEMCTIMAVVSGLVNPI